jgi:hypothetical protein
MREGVHQSVVRNKKPKRYVRSKVYPQNIVLNSLCDESLWVELCRLDFLVI